MARTHSERHGARFTDDLKDVTETYIPRKSSKDGDDLSLAFGHRGMSFEDLHEVWDFDVTDVRATDDVVYVDVTVNGRIGD